MGPPPAVAEVRLAVRRSLRGLERGSLVVVACSGGADSMAIAKAAAFEGPRGALRVGALTVDHQLQPGSAQRAGAVAETLEGLGMAPVEILAVTVGQGGGPEAAARAARYAAIDEAAERLGAAAVLLGHTRDDQAETVLLGLARGSGARSLSGMAATVGIYRRPVLELSRETVRSSAEGLPVWDDPHNDDFAFARVRVRSHALPALEKALGPGVAAALARSARQLRADADALDDLAAAAVASLGDGGAGGVDVSWLTALPTAIRTRVIRLVLIACGCRPSDLSAAHGAAVDDLVMDWHGQGPLHLPQRVRASRACGRLLINRLDVQADEQET